MAGLQKKAGTVFLSQAQGGLPHTVVDGGRGTAEGCFVQYSRQVDLYLEASFN